MHEWNDYILEVMNMLNFYGTTGHKTHILQFTTGDMLLEGIQAVIDRENIKNAFLTSGLGTLDRCRMHYVASIGFPAQDVMQTWMDEPIGIAAMSGIIANGQPHIHMVISTYSGESKTYTGHLEEGCRVLYRVEMIIQEIEDLELTRVSNENGIEVLSNKAR